MEGVAISSIATELYTRTPDSHIGILICFRTVEERQQIAQKLDCDPKSLPEDGVLMWEVVRNMHDSCIDLVTATVRKSGPRLVSLRERFLLNSDELLIRLVPLERTNSREMHDIQLSLLLVEFVLHCKDWTFETSPFVLFKAAYDRGPLSLNDREPRSHSMFCSDGVGRCLIYCGLMSAECNTRELTPADFDSDDPYHLPLVNCRLKRPPHLLASPVTSITAVEVQINNLCSIQ
jgi:hypothetical protein